MLKYENVTITVFIVMLQNAFYENRDHLYKRFTFRKDNIEYSIPKVDSPVISLAALLFWFYGDFRCGV